MVNLDGKFIPIAYFHEYMGSVSPDENNRSGSSGEKRLPKEFPFRVTLDRFGHIYFIPLFERREADGRSYWDISYTINDIIEAASGSVTKRRKIDDVHADLQREYVNYHMMQNDFLNAYWGLVESTFIEDYVNAFGTEPVLPEEVTTYDTLSVEEAVELASKAQISSET